MSRWYTLHIKNEILFWFLFLSLLPIIGLTITNYWYQKNEYEKTALFSIQDNLDSKINEINLYINDIKNDITTISNNKYIKDSIILSKNQEIIPDDFTSNMENIITKTKYHDLMLIDTNGDILYTVAKEKDLNTNLITGAYSKTNLAKTFKNSLIYFDTQISEFEYYAPSNKMACFLATPIYGDEVILGVLVLQINIDEIHNIFIKNNNRYNTYQFYAGKLNSNNLATPVTPLKATSNHFNEIDYKKLPLTLAVNGESSSGLTTDYSGNHVAAAWTYIPELRLGMVAQVDVDEVLQPINELGMYSIFILFFVSLGIILVIFSAIRNIVQPIEHLTQNIKNFTKGKLANTEFVVDVKNEIGDLANNFNKMTKALQISQETIRKYADELEIKVQERTAELENAKNTIEDKNIIMGKYFDILDRFVITSSTDLDGIITKASKAFCDISGYTQNELIGKNHNIIRHPDMPQEIFIDIWNTIKGGQTWSGELKNSKKDGGFYWIQSTISPIFNEQYEIIEYASIRQDITDKKRVEEISITDGLTKIYNRRYFDEIFPKIINSAKRNNELINFILLDIDHFKLYNDNYGHQMGDKILIEFAQCLKRHLLRADDYCFRIGGEEFGVLFKTQTKEKAEEYTNNLVLSIENMHFEHNFNSASKFITASMGLVSENANNITSIDDLYKKADDGLYKAKKSGRNRYCMA